MTSFKQFLAQNNPDLLPEELQQVDEVSFDLLSRASKAAGEKMVKAGKAGDNKGEQKAEDQLNRLRAARQNKRQSMIDAKK